jgi:serine protease
MFRRAVTSVGVAILLVVGWVGATAAVAAPSDGHTQAVPGDGGAPGASGAHGHKVIFPTREASDAGVGNDGAVHGAAGRASTTQLVFGGGVDGVGVTTGTPRVYLVFWGSQWGTAATDSSGTMSFTNDAAGVAPRLQAMFRGLGTGSELWSGVMTQYCEGVATGATSCPSTASHVGYPTGGALAGVWYDNGGAEPVQPNDNQLAQEAIAAAGHFGNTTPAQNRNAQYVVVSSSGLHPGGFNTLFANWCAWHDWNGDTTLVGGPATSPYGDIAFTNLPYLLDLGASCGQNYVNSGSSGTLDGVTMVSGHEYAETITDQNPPGGWTDLPNHNENADKCAWNGVGGSTGANNLTLATGTFAMQATWSNSDAGCRFSGPIVVNGPPANTITVTNPGNQNSTVGQNVSLPIQATDSGGATMTYAATGLPAGLSIDSSSGVISGTVTAGGTSNPTVTVTDATGGLGTTSFTWTVPLVCSATQAVGNGNFDTGAATPWSISASRILNNSTASHMEPPHSPLYDAFLGGLGRSHTDTVSQTVTIPSGCATYTLAFWLHIDTAETTTHQSYDTLRVTLGSSTLATYSNLNKNTGYIQKTFNVASFAGSTVTLQFRASENSSRQTSFVLDDISLTAN